MLAAAVLLATGLPQPWLLSRAASFLFDVELIAEDVSLFGAIQAGRLEVFDPESPADPPRPVAVVEGFTLEYSLIPRNGSFVQSILVDRLDLFPDFSSAEASNAAFLRRLISESSDGSSYTSARDIRIAHIAVEWKWDSAVLAFDDLTLSAEFDALGGSRIEIISDALAGSVQLTDRSTPYTLPARELRAAFSTHEDGIVGEAHFGAEGKRAVEVVFLSGDEEGGRAIATLRDIDLIPWIEYVSDGPLETFVLGPVNGSLELKTGGGGLAYSLTPDLLLSDVSWRGFKFDHVSVTGSLAMDREFEAVNVGTLRAEADDYLSYFEIANGRFEFVSFEGSTGFNGNIDLAMLGETLSDDRLWGEGVVEGSIFVNEQVVSVSAELRSELVGYDEFAAPYQTPLTGSTRLEFDRKTRLAVLHDSELRLGPGTSLSSPKIVFGPGDAIEGHFDFISDLAVAVDMDLLDSADANVLGSADVEYRDDRLGGAWEIEADLAEVVLPDEAATIQSWLFSAEGIFQDGLKGEGHLSGERLSIAGALSSNIVGDVKLQENNLFIPEATADLLGGSLNADIKVGLFEERFPIRLKARLDRIDLVRLTEEVQPPAVSLTGVVNGHAEIDYTLDGIQAFSLEASSEGGLTVNRDLVEKLLRSDALESVLGVRRLERMLTKLLGSAPQRPFDTGKLSLSLKGDEFVGRCELKSAETEDYNGLNLNIDLAIDVPALAESLKLLEQTE